MAGIGYERVRIERRFERGSCALKIEIILLKATYYDLFILLPL